MNFGDDEIGRAVQKVFDNQRAGRPSPVLNPYVDPKDLSENRADHLQGADRRPEIWQPVMEYHSFAWYEPTDLDRLVGPLRFTPRHLKDLTDSYGRPLRLEGVWAERPHSEGQWRNDLKPDHWRIPAKLKMAFTIYDLVTLFRTPEAFDQWFRDQVRLARAARAGIKLART